jgi:hypothetical protein
MARKATEDRNKEALGTGYVRLVAVRKIDGVSRDIFGTKGYSMDCEIDYEVVKGWKWAGFSGDLGPLANGKPPEGMTFGGPDRTFKKGEKIVVKTLVEFEKAEKGWRPL